jgi:hypothetical protein
MSALACASLKPLCYIRSIEQSCIQSRLLGPTSPSDSSFNFSFHVLLIFHSFNWASEVQGWCTPSTWVQSHQNEGALAEPLLACTAVLENFEENDAFKALLLAYLLQVTVCPDTTKVGNGCLFPLEFKSQCTSFNELVTFHWSYIPCKSPHCFRKVLDLCEILPFRSLKLSKGD